MVQIVEADFDLPDIDRCGFSDRRKHRKHQNAHEPGDEEPAGIRFYEIYQSGDHGLVAAGMAENDIENRPEEVRYIRRYGAFIDRKSVV